MYPIPLHDALRTDIEEHRAGSVPRGVTPSTSRPGRGAVELDGTMRRHRHLLTVRYADTDAQGHVYFANYLTFFDEALTGYLHAIGYPPKALLAAGCDVVFVDAKVSYRGSSHFEDRLAIDVGVTRIGATSLTFEVEARRGDDPIASGTLVQVCVAPETHAKVPVPEPLREAIASFEQAGAD